MLYPLQTYYVDPLGGVSMLHRTSVVGEKLNYIESSLFFDERNGSFRIITPYLLAFTESRHHYSTPKDLVFNWSTFASLSPESLHITRTVTYVMRSFIVNITNVMTDEVLEIVEAEESTPNIYVKFFYSVQLKPGESMSMVVFVMPHEPGCSSELIMIRTSKGTIPYHFVMRAVQTSKDIAIPKIYHQSSSRLANISFRIPPALGKKRMSIVFDSFVFDARASGATGRFVQLGPKVRSPGFYITHCHMFNGQTSRTLPLVLYVTQKLLLSYHPVIFMDTVTSRNGQAESDIKLVNPTDLSFTIVSLSLSEDSPSNVHVEPLPPPILVDKQSHSVIGKVVATGANPGEFSATVLVTYEDADQKISTLEIPVRGYVEYGNLEPSQSIIEIFTSSTRQTFHIHFTNHFSRPVAILAARTESMWLMVVGFKPMIVEPGARSEDITVKYKQTDFESFESMLIVETNVTNYHIPIQVFREQMMLSKSPDNFTNEGKVVYNFRKVFCGASTTLTVYVKNPNPIPCAITDVKTSPGIYVSGFWNSSRSNLRNHTISAFAQEEISLKIGFAKVQISHRQRNDTVTFGSPGSSVTIVISWIPYAGHLQGFSSLPAVVQPGRLYNGSLYLTSTYELVARVRNLSTNLKFLHLSCNGRTPVMCKGGRINIGTMNVMFTPEALEQTSIGHIFKHWRNISYQLDVWREFSSPNTLALNFFVHLKKNVVLRATFDVAINGTSFFNASARIGPVLPHTTVVVRVDVRSRFDCWVGFHGDTFDAAIGPHESGVLEIPYTVGGIGRFSYLYPISTNLTAPFFCNISGIVVKPRVKFVNNAGSRLKNAAFVLDAPSFDGKWTRRFFLENLGRADVDISPFSVSSDLLAIETNCTDVLRKQESCVLNVSVVAKALREPFEEANITVLAQGIPTVLGVTVTQTVSMLRMMAMKKVCELSVLFLLAFGLHIVDMVNAVRKQLRTKRDFRVRAEKLRLLLGDLNVVTQDLNVSHQRNPGNIRRMVFQQRPLEEMELHLLKDRTLT